MPDGSPLVPPPRSPISVQQVDQLTEAVRQQARATLAAALITASGRPHSIQQALDLECDFHFAMHPAPNSGAYQEWAKTKNKRLNEPHI